MCPREGGEEVGGRTEEDGTDVDRVTLEDVAESLCDLSRQSQLGFSDCAGAALTAMATRGTGEARPTALQVKSRKASCYFSPSST